MGQVAFMTPKKISFISPGLASIRSDKKTFWTFCSPGDPEDPMMIGTPTLSPRALPPLPFSRACPRLELGEEWKKDFVKTTSFKSPGLASIRSGTVSPVRCFSSPEERPDDRLVFAVTASHPTLSLPKPQAPHEAKRNRGSGLRIAAVPVGTEQSEGKMEKGFGPPKTTSFESPGLASNRSGTVSPFRTRPTPGQASTSSPSPFWTLGF